MTTFLSLLMIGLLFLLPTVLWIWCIVDIIRSEFFGNNKVIWLLIVIFVPVLGVILYYLIGRGQKLSSSPSISNDAPTQPAKVSTKKIVLAVVLGFLLLGGGTIGIVAAIAVPQFTEYRMKGYNASASSDLKNAKTGCESYFADNNRYPESARDIQMNADPNVVLEYRVVKRSENGEVEGYELHTYHKDGDKEFINSSEETQIYWKERGQPDTEYRQL